MSSSNPFPGLPDFGRLRVPLQKNPAEWMYERIVRSIADFEGKLDDSQEVGLRLVNFGNQETVHIEDVGFWGPDLVKFYGSSPDGRPIELMQHISQVSILLVAIPTRAAKARRIGFELTKQLKPS